MDFFENPGVIPEGEDQPEDKKIPAETGSEDTADASSGCGENGFSMPEGAVESDEIVDRDFWKGLTLPEVRPERKKAKHWLFNAAASLVFIAAGFGIACVSARGQGFLSNLVTGGKHMTFSLPVSDKPQSSSAVKDESGKYADAEGIAEDCVKSVVSLDIYSEGSDFIAAGQGSGIIMSEDGYIVSNAHVVDKGTKAIKAVLYDGSEYAAELIGSDPKTDIAVIKIPAEGLTPAEFGNSEDVRLGEEVVAIGCPAGYRNSVTKGIVSGLDRTIRLESSSTGVNCIQIDAPINPGNSGGALFNMWGQVIGITSSKLASVDYEGLGFAISTNQAADIIEQLIEYGHVADRVRIGITYYTVSKTTADIYGITPGLCVAGIDESCDVAKTELKEGDIITSIDGTDVTTMDDIAGFVNKNKKPGDEIVCHVYRAAGEDSAEKEFDITFKVMEDSGSLTEAE
ncbi:MAG: trypsin-like peptidase domain-containing protein [Ruminococcus sp.]|nr:trypsin-like peptidase domain-containing protein [Ruminococcus sp.]